MIDYEVLRLPLRRRLYSAGYTSEEITKLLDEFSIEEMFRLGIFYKTKTLSKRKYEIDDDGKLQCSNTTKRLIY